MTKNILYKEWKAEQMKDPKFREALEEFEPAYQVTRLRLKKGLTQAELAELVGTTQSSIARLESGNRQPSLTFLRKVVKVLGGRVEVKIYDEEELVSAGESQNVEYKFFETKPIIVYAVHASSVYSLGGKFTPMQEKVY